MQLVISHDTALRFWRTFAGNVADLKTVRRPAPMAAPVPITSDLQEELISLGIVPTPRHPLDLLFATGAVRTRASLTRAHATGLALPAGSLLQLSEHVAITGPELTFALVSRECAPGLLILIGCELCGTYVSTRPGEPRAERPPLTTASRLGAYLARLRPKNGSRAAKLATYVFDGAASPMEAKLALLLSLPSTMGGYGLPRPVLNRPFDLSPDAQRIYSRTPCRLDLSWPGTNLDVEYDGSGDEHTAEMHTKDVARLAALRLDGLDVLVLAKQQVYDTAAFARMAQVITGKLTGEPARAWRIRTKDFAAKQTALRESLNLL